MLLVCTLFRFEWSMKTLFNQLAMVANCGKATP